MQNIHMETGYIMTMIHIPDIVLLIVVALKQRIVMVQELHTSSGQYVRVVEVNMVT